MVNFFAVGERNSELPVHNLYVVKVNGQENYRLAATESNLENFPVETEIIQAIKFDSFGEIKNYFYDKQAIIKIPGYPDLLLKSIQRYDQKTKCFKLACIDQKIHFDGDVVVISRKSKINIFI